MRKKGIVIVSEMLIFLAGFFMVFSGAPMDIYEVFVMFFSIIAIIKSIHKKEKKHIEKYLN